MYAPVVQPVSLVAWSPNGHYLASADLDGLLVVWNAATKDVLIR